MSDPAESFDHDPAAEPYASMTKLEILDLMERAGGRDEWERLNLFLIDKMTSREMEAHARAVQIGRFLVGLYEADGTEQCAFLCGLAGRLAAEVAAGMPPIEPPEVVN